MWELRAHLPTICTRTQHAARVCQERRAKIFQRHTVGRVARACARAAPLAQPRSARGHAQDLAVRRVRAVTLRSSLLGGRGGREADMVRSLCSWGAPPLRRCAPRFARPVPWTPQATFSAGRAWSGSAPGAAPSACRAAAGVTVARALIFLPVAPSLRVRSCRCRCCARRRAIPC